MPAEVAKIVSFPTEKDLKPTTREILEMLHRQEWLEVSSASDGIVGVHSSHWPAEIHRQNAVKASQIREKYAKLRQDAVAKSRGK